ncbi:Atp22p NDAI_0C04640 [Naumovozyma dairenensis CBS 421]|uniref:Uncharacterized protein n=1 Tax=Naumovozyma dairenensis (strain ATCC 10597 / BCRC 20456 / CBS 421 / NBRC 0211 / NRRL Y-12639) TaxID=1071378 RepID=G0W8L2_NAUDC|nr:hypothetical protein NDAI_0C04640 [Naumovozyma dairenensis CBS 421]CCD24123.1 hypothetical protein NDAI_0C04640 [Naumovozyma dairenensis CBS 421]
MLCQSRITWKPILSISTRLIHNQQVPTIRDNDSQLTDDNKKGQKIYSIIQRKKIDYFYKQTTSLTPRLVNLIDSIQNPFKLKAVIKHLQNHYGKERWPSFLSHLTKFSKDPDLFILKTHTHLNRKQYSIFIQKLRTIITTNDLPSEKKRQELYKLINLQYILFSRKEPFHCFILPDDIHKWFFENINKKGNEIFNHYKFLIDNDIHLSSSLHVQLLLRKLLQGSELDIQLVTFRMFFQFNSNRSKYVNSKTRDIHFIKFVKLYDLNFMILLINKYIQRNDFRLINLYLKALLEKLRLHRTINNDKHPNFKELEQKRQLAFIKFNNMLIHIVSKIGNIHLFTSIITFQIKYLQDFVPNSLKGNDSTILNLLHKPIHDFIRLLKSNGNQDDVFKLCVQLQKINAFQINKSYRFKNLILFELISSLKSLKDPKLSTQYLLSIYPLHESEKLAILLNNLNLWGWIFHDQPIKLSNSKLQSELQNIMNTSLLSDDMKLKKITPNIISPFISQIYSVLIETKFELMGETIYGKENYKAFLLNIYSNYKSYLQHSIIPNVASSSKNKLLLWKHNTSILNIILTAIKSKLYDTKLAYNVLLDFTSNSHFLKKIKMKNNNSFCPFSTVIYNSDQILTEHDLFKLFQIMEDNNVPLSFKTCVAMVFRYLKIDNKPLAKQWYDKILRVGFPINHFSLIKIIKENGWDFPLGFDKSLLEKLQQNEQSLSQSSSISETDQALLLDSNINALEDIEETASFPDSYLQNVQHKKTDNSQIDELLGLIATLKD